MSFNCLYLDIFGFLPWFFYFPLAFFGIFWFTPLYCLVFVGVPISNNNSIPKVWNRNGNRGGVVIGYSSVLLGPCWQSVVLNSFLFFFFNGICYHCFSTFTFRKSLVFPVILVLKNSFIFTGFLLPFILCYFFSLFCISTFSMVLPGGL